MIRRTNAPMNRQLYHLKRPSYKQPVDCAGAIEKGPRGPRSQFFAAKRIEQHRAADVGGNTVLRYIEVQVARNEECDFLAVTSRIGENFSQLSAAQLVVAAAFKMKVIGNKGQAADLDVGDEGDSAAHALLKRLRARQIPTRTPKVRLLAKADQSRVGQRPARECRLTVICG